MSKKAKKKASKRTTKRTAKKRTTKRVAKKTTRRRRRTPAQIRATKKLVAANRARAKKHVRHGARRGFVGPLPPREHLAAVAHKKRFGVKYEKLRQQYFKALRKLEKAEEAPVKPVKHVRHGARRGFVGPLPPREHLAAVAHKKQFGVKYEKLRQQYFKSKRRPTVTAAGLLKKSKAPTTAAGILRKATKEAKYSRLKPIMTQRTTKNAALWICGNPSGKRTGCGGGKAGRLGSRVVGILA